MNAADEEFPARPSVASGGVEIEPEHDDRPWIGYEAAFPGSWSSFHPDVRHEIATD